MTSSFLLFLVMMWCADLSTSGQVKREVVGHGNRRNTNSGIAVDEEPYNYNYAAIHGFNSMGGKVERDNAFSDNYYRRGLPVPFGTSGENAFKIFEAPLVDNKYGVDARSGARNLKSADISRRSGSGVGFSGFPESDGESENLVKRSAVAPAFGIDGELRHSGAKSLKSAKISRRYGYGVGFNAFPGSGEQYLDMKSAPLSADGRDSFGGLSGPRFQKSSEISMRYGSGVGSGIPESDGGSENLVKRSAVAPAFGIDGELRHSGAESLKSAKISRRYGSGVGFNTFPGSGRQNLDMKSAPQSAYGRDRLGGLSGPRFFKSAENSRRYGSGYNLSEFPELVDGRNDASQSLHDDEEHIVQSTQVKRDAARSGSTGSQ